MNAKNQSTGAIFAAALLLACGPRSHAQTTTFGSDNDGYGGFTADNSLIIPTPEPEWTLGTSGAIFTNGPIGDSGQVNSSLLKQFTLDRTAGMSYTITGIADWTSTYAADNNRLGILLFSSSDDITGADSGISLQVNAGTNTIRFLLGGVNGTQNTSATLSGVTGADLIGQTLTYSADVDFVGTDINIDFTLSAPVNSYSQTISATVAAADYTGDFFGFGSRGRQRSTTPGVNDIPFVYEAKSFDVSVIPEPSTLALLGAAAGMLHLLRRRRRR